MAKVRFDTRSLDKDITRAVDQLNLVSSRAGRKAMRAGAAASGTLVLKAARLKAPKAETGLFGRSLMKKPITNAARGVYMSLIGQNLKRSGGKDQGEGSNSRGFTANQASKAMGANKGISTGISGTGKAVPMHFTMRPVKPHEIGVKNKLRLAWNRGPANTPIDFRSAIRVKHPGRKNPTRWLTTVKKQSQGKVTQIFFRTVSAQLDTITSSSS